MMQLVCHDILGFPVTDEPMPRLMEFLEESITDGRTVQVVTLNPEMMARQSHDAGFNRILQEADLLVADGSGILLAARFLRMPIQHKIPGVELVEAVFLEGARRGWRLYCLGGTVEVLKKAVARTRERFPGVRLAGWHHGYFTDEGAVVQDINRSKADVLLVGLGSPRQEEWIARHRLELTARVLVGVGGSFDVIGESKRRAPVFFRKLSLEWVWRVASEPRRLRRVIPAFCRFGWLVVCHRLGKRCTPTRKHRE